MSAVCCVFTETWLHSHILDHSVVVPSFSTVWADRDVISSRKKKGGVCGSGEWLMHRLLEEREEWPVFRQLDRIR